MNSISVKKFLFVICFLIISSEYLYSKDSLIYINPENNESIFDSAIENHKLYFETANPELSDEFIREHLTELFPIISEKDIYRIIETKKVVSTGQTTTDTLNTSAASDVYKVSFEVPENFLVDSAKILWVLNIPEFQSRIYQLYEGKEIYIDTWPNVVGTIKDKTYTGNFQAYKIRNWPFYKDPDPLKASLPPVKPGPGNPLGLFVVHYDENSLRYFHGTNNPKVLNNQLRNLSHGCIRNDNDNIAKMKEFIIRKVVRSKDLSDWSGSKRTMIYEFEERDKFPVQIIYKTYEVDIDLTGKYIMLFKDVYKYENSGNINSELNDEGLIFLTNKENIYAEYRKKFGSEISDDALNMMIEYVINNGEEYQKYYIDDLKEKFMIKD